MCLYVLQVFPREELASALADGHKYSVIDYTGDVQDVSKQFPRRIVSKII